MRERGKGIILNYIMMIFKLLMGLIYTPFMLSKIGDSQYGILSLANSFIIFITLLDCGFGQTLIRYQTKNKIEKKENDAAVMNGLFIKLYLLVSGIALIVGIAIMYFYPIISRDEMSLEEMELFRKVFMVLLTNSVLTFPLRIFSADMQVHEKFSFFKGASLILLIMRYIIMTVLLVAGFKVLALAVVISVTSLLTQIAYMGYCIIKLKFKITFGKIDKSLKREIYAFSFFILINLVVDFLYDSTDKLILGAISGTTTVTIYTLGVTFYSYFKQLSTGISGVYLPKIIEEYEKTKDMNVISCIFTKVSRLQLFVLALVLNIFIIYGKDFIRLWVGDGYEEAYTVGVLILISMVIPLSQNLGQSILRAMNLHKYRSYMYLSIALLNIIMTIFFAEAYGAIGAALSTAIATFLGEILFLNWFYSSIVKIEIKPYWLYFIKMTIMSFLLDIVLCQIRIKNWGVLILAILLYCAIYVGLFFRIISNEYERKLARKILRIEKE